MLRRHKAPPMVCQPSHATCPLLARLLVSCALPSLSGFLLNSRLYPHTADLQLKYVLNDCVIENFKASPWQTLLHMCNKARVHSPEECCVTLVGKNLAQRHVVLPRIQPIHHLATLEQLCNAAPFQVHDVEISHAVDAPAVAVAAGSAPAPTAAASTVITISDSDDDAAGAGPADDRSDSDDDAAAAGPAQSRTRTRVKQKASFRTGSASRAVVRRPSPARSLSPQAARRPSPRPRSLSPLRRYPSASAQRASPWPMVTATWAIRSPQRAPVDAALYAHKSRSPSPSYDSPGHQSPMHASYQPTSPSYQPVSPTYSPTFPAAPAFSSAALDRVGFSPAPAAPALSSVAAPWRHNTSPPKTPPRSAEVYECEGGCGFEGTLVDVEAHERGCALFDKHNTWWCDLGCGFAGTFDEVKEHEFTCSWRMVAATTTKCKSRPRAGAKSRAKKGKPAPAPIIDKDKPPALPATRKSKPALATVVDQSKPAALPATRKRKPAPASIVDQSKPAPASIVDQSKPAPASILKKSNADPPPLPEQAPPSTKASDDKERLKVMSEELERLNATPQRQKLVKALLASTKELAQTLSDHTPKYYKHPAVPYEQVVRGSPEFEELEKEFMVSAGIILGGHDYKVKQLYRIQDTAQNVKFQTRRMMLNTRNPLPTMEFRDYEYPNDVGRFWHGTEQDTVPKIRATGFDRSANGGNGAALGEGTYFGSSVELPLNGECGVRDRYSRPDKNGCKHIMLAAVILGHCVVGNSTWKVFPPGVQSTVDYLDTFTKICSHSDDNHLPLYHFVIETAKKK